MAWKKALFLGGAVLLLAACSDATAPGSLTRGGTRAAARTPGVTAPTLTVDGQVIESPECRSGYYVRSGDKDVCIELPEIP